MTLYSFNYAEFRNKPSYWALKNFELNKINLLVGKNASGKSRTINVIACFSRLLNSSQKATSLGSGSYHAIFKKGSTHIEYKLVIENRKILYETMSIDDKVVLNRGQDGVGQILSSKTKDLIEFQTPPEEIAALVRRDNINHDFLEDLFNWANNAYHFEFGTTLGRDIVAIFASDAPKFDKKNTMQATGSFREGLKLFGDDFKKSVISDFNSIGYKLTDIGIDVSQTIQIQGSVGGEPNIIWIQEENIPTKIEQFQISQGMFRALSLIIQLSLMIMSSKSGTILIDDIGEGLDFDRSCNLIKLLQLKINTSDVQLVMSTNDRFVMNSVDLKYWSIINRNKSECSISNYENSKEKFEDFKFTGLNNFDFFSSDFLNN